MVAHPPRALKFVGVDGDRATGTPGKGLAHEMLSFGIAMLVHLGQIMLGFYGFWLLWRVLLPVLPGPTDPAKRIAPFAKYFTDPLAAPLIRVLRQPPWLADLFLLVADAAALAALTRTG